MAIWQDIDASFQKNIYNDVGLSTDENNISTTLYNNMMIDSIDRPFENRQINTIEDVLHSELNFITEDRIKQIIRRAALLDDRIISIDDIVLTERPNEYLLDVKIQMTVNMSSTQKIVVNFQLSRA